MADEHQGAEVIELFRNGWRFEDGEHRRYADGKRVGRVWRQNGEWKALVRTYLGAFIDGVESRGLAMERVDYYLATVKEDDEDACSSDG